jgi:diacylglycerol O-acyltransferase
MGGLLFVGSARVRGRLSLSVGSWVVGGTNTREALRASLRQSLADMKLSGTIE